MKDLCVRKRILRDITEHLASQGPEGLLTTSAKLAPFLVNNLHRSKFSQKIQYKCKSNVADPNPGP